MTIFGTEASGTGIPGVASPTTMEAKIKSQSEYEAGLLIEQ